MYALHLLMLCCAQRQRYCSLCVHLQSIMLSFQPVVRSLTLIVPSDLCFCLQFIFSNFVGVCLTRHIFPCLEPSSLTLLTRLAPFNARASFNAHASRRSICHYVLGDAGSADVRPARGRSRGVQRDPLSILEVSYGNRSKRNNLSVVFDFRKAQRN